VECAFSDDRREPDDLSATDARNKCTVMIYKCTVLDSVPIMRKRKPRRGGTKPVARGIPPYYRPRGSWRNGRLALPHATVASPPSGRSTRQRSPTRPSSAGRIANKSNANRPATPMKAGLGKSFIAIGRLIAPPQNKSASRMGKVG
jgi:hypothetical protein